jgi:hypothetical protein
MSVRQHYSHCKRGGVMALGVIFGLVMAPLVPLSADSAFDLGGFKDQQLYPETDIVRFPGFVGSLDHTYLQLGARLDSQTEWETRTRQDDVSGAVGGTLQFQSLQNQGDFSLNALFKEKAHVAGFGVLGGFRSALREQSWTNYLNYTQAETLTLLDEPFYLGAMGIFGVQTKSLRHGYRLAYRMDYSAAVAEWQQDSSLASPLRFVKSVLDDSDSLSNQVDFSASWGGKIDNLDLDCGLNYQFNYLNRDRKYLAYDSTGDGFNDSFTTYSEWATKTDLFPEGSQIKQLRSEDRSFGHRISVDALAKVGLTKTIDVALLAKYVPLDLQVQEARLHQLTEVFAEDLSYTATTRSHDWGNFMAGTIVYVKDPKNCAELALWGSISTPGRGYRLRRSYKQRGVLV